MTVVEGVGEVGVEGAEEIVRRSERGDRRARPASDERRELLLDLGGIEELLLELADDVGDEALARGVVDGEVAGERLGAGGLRSGERRKDREAGCERARPIVSMVARRRRRFRGYFSFDRTSWMRFLLPSSLTIDRARV